ncbi:MAG: SusC/RagA family TonB-linked outer membrane protein [Bacteroidota bacterium]|nr:SusC/RagA family TonB-linked outer membrane protein [Bacteroidota bacterium]
MIINCFSKKLIRRLISVLLFTMVFSGHVWANTIQVSGKVTSSVDGNGLPGVSVVVKGTGTGVITNTNGDYSINVPGENSILRFSFVGYEVQEILVGNKLVINIVLQESIQRLDEVVVTALGITRQEKSLGYAVGKVDGEDMTRVTRENVISSLAGKVAGVTVNSTGGTGSSVSMVIRGATSLSSDNQPLFVVDGVPMISGLSNTTQFGERNIVDYGNAISDLNPDDVESVSILKGPSAAALYGSRAGNGVVLITTKRGRKSKGITVSITSNTVFDKPYKYFETQKHFSSGYFSFTPDNYPGSVMVVDPAQGAGAGIECDKGYFAIQWHSPRDANGNKVPIELVSYPNNIANFVQTGITSTNGVSVSSNTDRMNYRLGVTNMTNRGIIPNADLFKNNFSVGSDIRATDNLTISSNINISKSWSNNRPSSNRGTNPLEWAYKIPLNINILDLQDYWEPGQEGVQQRTPANGLYDNPYFLANEVNNSFARERFFGNMKAVWQISPELSIMTRYSIDRYDEKRETKISPSYTRESNNGAYGIVDIKNFEGNADVLATYTKKLNNFDISVSAGGNSLYRKGSSISTSSKPSTGLIVPGVYTISNIKSGSLNYGSSWYQKAIYSLYGIANLSYKSMIYLDLTARNDWSSTLPKENQSYFYPSASLSVLLNEMLEVGDMFDLLKMRGGWAKVGNDANPYQLYPSYGNAGQWGDATRLSKSGTILTPNLKPEEATSWEIGADMRIARDRIRIEGTYYSVANRNQIIRNIPIASSSGFSRMNINAGLIESKGWEFLFGGTPIRNSNLRWDIDVNFSRNRTTLVEISDGIDFIEFWRDAKGGAKTYVGDQIGDIYDATLLVVEDPNSPYYGYPIVGGENLRWQDDPSEAFMTKIGNYNPDFILGLQSGLSYKGFTLNMTFDWRKGGQFVSQTHRYMSENKNSQHWLDQMINPGDRTGQELRDWLVENEETLILNGFHVIGGPTSEYGGFPEGYSGVYVNDGAFIPGVIQNSDGTYTENLGEDGTMFVPYIILYPWSFTKSSTFDADFIKLREISLSYQIPSKYTHRYGIQDVTVSIYSRNIILWTKAKIGIDPERAFQAEASGFKQGIERYNLEPWVMPIGFKFNLTF